ncbi:PucR C-terminal helix-turn-helix domain-containing protein [Thermomonospora echinospora]|uniref:PucR C-terminal helix-turn-helix domain-containing protein n=1 Tax=Thermomonospora echinospora TaxID=1992 RepID=A0A1H5TCP7_9ACTN|nr:helix-turn-helix domain-containing protein [Thermomonospora echinospora]SEF60540.1 PucR C-terminal helix-turn-helix domain-containing protein [Thermomonospora echinospora]
MDPERAAGFWELLHEQARDPALLEATVRAARSRSPLVAELPEEETRRHTRALVEGAIDALAKGGEPGEEALRAAERLGSDRARQGVPVAALLDGFQAGRSHLVRALIDEGLTRGIPAEVLLKGVTRIDAITTALVHRMVHAHRVTELELARTTREGHVQMLRQLLHGEPVAVPAPLDPSVPYHCVVSDISDPALAQRLEPVLCGPAKAGLSGLVDGRLAALVPRLPGPSALPAGTPLLVASPAARPADVAELYQLALRALRAALPHGLDGLHHLTGLALMAATAAEPVLGRLLAGDLLAGLVPGDPFHRELAETALAYLDHGGRIEPTAAAVHVHPNTVKYRLRRLQDLTGRPLVAEGGNAVSHSAHWWWALHAWLR